MGGFGTKEGGCDEKERGENRQEWGVRKTHAGQTMWKTVAEEECVECVTT